MHVLTRPRPTVVGGNDCLARASCCCTEGQESLDSSLDGAVLKGKDSEGAKEGGAEDKPVVNPLENKEAVLHPPQPVPVRLDSEPLESASSQDSAEGSADPSDRPTVGFHCSVPVQSASFGLFTLRASHQFLTIGT